MSTSPPRWKRAVRVEATCPANPNHRIFTAELEPTREADGSESLAGSFRCSCGAGFVMGLILHPLKPGQEAKV